MSDTVEVVVNQDTWTSVAGGGAGFVTNETGNGVFYKEAASQPGDTEQGHLLRPSDFFRFELETGQQIWVRTKNGTGNIVVTPD